VRDYAGRFVVGGAVITVREERGGGAAKDAGDRAINGEEVGPAVVGDWDRGVSAAERRKIWSIRPI
jgi:hypothetical protein